MSCWIDGRECSILSAGDERGILNARVEFCRDCERLKFWGERLERCWTELGVSVVEEVVEEEKGEIPFEDQKIIINYSPLILEAISNQEIEEKFKVEELGGEEDNLMILGRIRSFFEKLVRTYNE